MASSSCPASRLSPNPSCAATRSGSRGRRLGQLIVAGLALAWCSTAFASEVEKRLARILTDRVPGIEIESMRKLPQADLYEVVHNGRRILYATSNGKLALFGSAVDLGTRTDLTEQRMAQLNTVDFGKLPLDKAIKKVKGRGTRQVAIFSDPDCPFCKRLEAELAKVDDVTVYVFLLPLEQLHPDAPRKARAVWCAQDPVAAWDELMLNGREPGAAATECRDPIADIAKVADRLKIEGTPGLIFRSGRFVPGAIGAAEIERQLGPSGRS